MRKLVTLLVALSLVILTPAVAMAEIKVTAQPEASFVLKQTLVADGQKADLSYNAYSIGLPITVNNKFTVMPLIGVTDAAKLKNDDTVKFDNSPLYGVKLNVPVYNGLAKVDLLGEYQVTDIDVISDKTNITGIAKLQTYEAEARLSKDLEISSLVLTPYIGAVISDAKADFDLGTRAKANRNFGMSFGLGAKVNNSLSANVGGRIIDKEAITASVSYKF